jgi:hypothetical protein
MITGVPRPASPLSLHRHLSERSSPSRVRYAAQNPRPGPLRAVPNTYLREGKGGNCKGKTILSLRPCAASRWSAPNKNPLSPLTM